MSWRDPKNRLHSVKKVKTQCPCCPKGKTCKSPKALYRFLNGKDMFTGIVGLSDKVFLKLDNPRGPLDGPGHIMEDVEFISEMSEYDGSTNRAKPLLNVLNGMAHIKPDTTLDVFAPHVENADGTVNVRARDVVKIAALGKQAKQPDDSCKCCTKPMVERFYVDVVAVTCYGMILGFPQMPLYYSPIGPNNFISFPVEGVIGVRKGINWKKRVNVCAECSISSEKLKLCSGCKRVAYCSKECQKKNWKNHKHLCKFKY